ncbi:hypothetical protein [Silvimonas soli]|uniref:hypothetical protein n=1 Tax=Silvimonas soli TaxID=2980100 RepID=UPI0024B3BB0F|nr:hypothetical protein [Silvimonas soli]
MNTLIPFARHCAWALQRVCAAGAATTTVAACLLLSGCGGETGNISASNSPSTNQAVSGNTAPLGAGGVTTAVPIVLTPAPGPCAASGTAALQSPLLNSQIDCAP